MWFRGRKATLRDQADAIERRRSFEAQAGARVQLADNDVRIARLTRLVAKVVR